MGRVQVEQAVEREPAGMNCTQPRLSAQVLAWLEGALSPEVAAQIEAHVGACVACQDDVAYLRLVSGRVASAFRAQKSAPLASLCPDPGQLVEFASKSLDSSASFVIAEHLLVCAPCEAEVALLLEFETDEERGAGGGATEGGNPPASLAVRRAFEEEFRTTAGSTGAPLRVVETSGPFSRFGRWAASARRPLGAVATLAVIFGVSWMFFNSPQDVFPPPVEPATVSVTGTGASSPPPGGALQGGQSSRVSAHAPTASKPASGAGASSLESKDKGAASGVVATRAAKGDSPVALRSPVPEPRPEGHSEAPVVVDVSRPAVPPRPAVASVPPPSVPTRAGESAKGEVAEYREPAAPAPLPASTGGAGTAGARRMPPVTAGPGSVSSSARVDAPTAAAPVRVFKSAPAKAGTSRTEEGGVARPAPSDLDATRPDLKSAPPADGWDKEQAPSNRTASPGGGGQQNQAPVWAKGAPRQQVVTGGLASQGRPSDNIGQSTNRSPGEQNAAPAGSVAPVQVARSRDVQSNATVSSSPVLAQKAARIPMTTSSVHPPPASQAPAAVSSQTAWQTKSAGDERFRGSGSGDWRESMVIRARQAVTGALASQDFALQLSVLPPSARRMEDVRAVRVRVVVPATTGSEIQERIRSAVTRALHLDASRGDAVTISTQ